MEPPQRPKPALGDLRGVQRRVMSASQNELVKSSLLSPDSDLPLVVRPNIDGVSLTSWASSNRDWVETRLSKHGGILFRGFGLSQVAEFEQFTQALSQDLLPYKERSSPRSAIAGNIYTSTEYPADQSIFLHNENSYQKAWPLRILFFCVIAAETGGETPIADCRKVLNRIAPEIRDRFSEKGVMYVRNFDNRLGLPWQTVFQTEDRAEVDAYCEASGIRTEWRENGTLRTRQVRKAVVKHPKTGEMIWFNHGAFFHISTLAPGVKDALQAEFAEEDLPNNTFYGDGAPIEPDVLDNIRAAYNAETVVFPWQLGDVLMLDNMMVAHGRAPFTGARKIAVGMAEPYSLT